MRRWASKDAAEGGVERARTAISDLEGRRCHRRPFAYARQGFHHAGLLAPLGDPDRISVSGTSAGGHLTVSALATRWQDLGLPVDALKGGCALNGLYDLEPIRLCYLNKEIGISPETSKRQSVINHLPAQAPPLILSTGGDESEEFQRHQRDLAAAWRQAGLACTVVDQPDGHHFDIIERFIDTNGPLGRAVLQFVRKAPPRGG